MLTSDPKAPTKQPDDDPEADAPPPRRARHRMARVVGAVGRLMMTSGVVVLLLVVYQLWGTNLQTNRSQTQLADQFAGIEDEPDATTTSTTEAPSSTAAPSTTEGGATGTTPAQVAPTIAPPGLGVPIGHFRIPAIGVNDDKYVVEGVGTEELKRGAGHYPGTPLPGQSGNASVAGHRTTYGSPLKNVDELEQGDEIFFTTLQGEFTYEVMEITIVDPSEVSVLEDKGDDRLTLTACHPEFSAEQRIIVAAELVGNPVAQLDGQEEAAQQVLDQTEDDPVAGAGGAIDVFATEPALRFPGAWWGLLCMALWGLTRVLAHVGHRTRRFPRLLPYLVGTPVTLLVLYLFFESFSFEGFARTVGLSL